MKKLVLLVLMGVLMITLSACTGGTTAAASTIAIDVNPSVVLELDENDEVINVVLNNEDAEIIVGDMDLIGVDYNVAINALIGSMVANGYINELANSVLLSIQSNDETHEADLMAALTQAVNDYLTGSSIEGSVITQSLDFDDDAEELAELLDISEAKAELILDIIEIDPRMTVEELAVLSINDLNLLLESKNYAFDNVTTTGSASDLGLIAATEAYQVALVELGVDEMSVLEFKVKLEQEDGTMVYEVEVETETDDFEILINAKDGTVFVEVDDDDDDDDDVFPSDALSSEEILNLLATELDLDASLVTEFEVDEEMENGIAFYEVEFDYEGTEYELEVDAMTGEIYSRSIEVDDDDDDEMDDDDDEIDEENEVDDDDDEIDEEETDDDDDTVTDGNEDTYLYLTATELAMYDGLNGNEAYIAVDGVLYSVTNNEAWVDGCHQDICAGTDVTEAFISSPHGEAILEDLTVVGELVSDES